MTVTITTDEVHEGPLTLEALEALVKSLKMHVNQQAVVNITTQDNPWEGVSYRVTTRWVVEALSEIEEE